jgi:hypothetical protein
MAQGYAAYCYAACTTRFTDAPWRPRLAKDSDSARVTRVAQYRCPNDGLGGVATMSEKTCAACDYPLDDKAISVRIAGKTVEVCCEECAVKLREAHASATTAATK